MRHLLYIVPLALVAAFVGEMDAGIVLDGGGLMLAEQGGTLDAGTDLALAGSAFGSTEHPADAHAIAHANDGVYGNGNSWLPMLSPLDTSPIIGISLGGTATSLQSIAFGRDNGESHPNGGSYVDRWAGLYTLQYTQVANPDNTTDDWTDIGTLDYQSAGGVNFAQPWLRHRFNFNPVSATGIRILSPQGNAIDEIELYAGPGAILEDPPIVLTPTAGFAIAWDENEGDFFDENAPPLQVGAPDNAALAVNGATTFGSSVYPNVAHAFEHANDGYYGNSNSWLGMIDGSDPDPFVGIDFEGTDPVPIDNIAFGRDNGNSNPPGTDSGLGGVLIDRWQGLYTLQYTLLADPDASTMETGDANTGWASIGMIELARQGVDDEPLQEPWLRHQFAVSTDGGGSILATGVRILTPQGNCIDEIEINSTWIENLVWDVVGHVDLTWEGSGNWAPGGGPPDVDARATIPAGNPDTITVGTSTAEAYSLVVEDGQMAIAAGQKLSIATEASFAPGTTLLLGAGATFSAGQGSVEALSTDGDATVVVTGSILTVGDVINTNPGSFTKQGSGTLSLSGANPLDGYSALILGGGTLDVRVLQNGVVLDEQDMSPSWLDPANPQYAGISFGAIDEPVQGDGTYHGPAYWLPAETPPELSFTLTPGLEGTDLTVDASWGVSFNHTIDADYFFDPDGPAGPEAEILLVQDIRQTSWNDQLADIGEAAGQEWSGFLEVGSGLDLTAESQFRVTGTLAGGASPEALTSGVWRFTFAAGVPEGPFDLSSTDVQVQTDSTLRVSTVEGAVALGLLTLESGTLTNTGVDLSFTGGTSIDAAADAVVGVNLQSEIDLGQINVVNPTPVTFVKAGPLDLVMTAASVGAAGFGNVTFDVQEGRLIGVHGANPFDTAALQLGGGDLILSSAGGNVSYDNALSVTESATLTAGAAGGGVAEALTVTLGGTAGNGLAVDAGKTLTVQTTDGYSLDIAATVDGPQGNVRVEQGAVSFTGGGSVASLRIPDGASVGIDADRPVTIGQTLTLGTTSLQIDQANTFSVSSPDLLAGGDVTLSGGTLTIANSSAPPVIVVPPEALALTGGIELVEERGDFAPGNLAEGGTPFAGAPLAGTLHAIEGLNDLTYGNGFSWIGDAGAAPIAGISLGASPISVGSIAFGRDNADSHANGGPFQYRWAGLYTLQYTQVPNPNETTSDESWTNIGTLDYIADDGEGFAEPMVRHRYVFDPVEATGIRLVVPNVGMAVGTCIDEIELYGSTSGPIDLSGSHFDVTADTTLHFNTDLGAALGAVTLGPDVTLTATGATLTVVDVGAGHGATIVAEAMDVLGTISPGNDGIGTLTIGDGELGLAGSATYDAQVSLSTGEADLIEVSVGSLQLGGTLNVIGTGRTTSNSYDAKLSRRVVNNNFGAIGDAPSGTGFEFDEVIPPFGPGAAAHVGHGAFLRDVAYPKNASNITEGVDIELFVALGGDADGDGKVWLSDWAALRANFGNTGTGKTWTDGNFDPWVDDKVWLSDWAALRANFGNSDYTLAAAAVPEPGTLAMVLSTALLGLLTRTLRTRRR